MSDLNPVNSDLVTEAIIKAATWSTGIPIYRNGENV